MMGSKFENNFESVEYPADTLVFTCSHNSGEMRFGRGTKMKICSHNKGTLHFGEYSQIDSISNNHSDIFIEDNSRITIIKNNNGRIYLGNNCLLDKVFLNDGIIFGGAGTTRPKGVRDAEPDEIIKDKESQLVQDALKVGIPWLNKLKKPQQSITTPVEDSICCVCAIKRRNTTFLCGHVCCETCAGALTKCHICRGPVAKRIKLFL